MSTISEIERLRIRAGAFDDAAAVAHLAAHEGLNGRDVALRIEALVEEALDQAQHAAYPDVFPIHAGARR